MIDLWRDRTRTKLLADFGAFCRRAWREIEPGKPLEWNWHHELLCEYLMLAYAREELRLIFCLPPRGLKSKLVSVFFPAWVWAKSPHESFILTSYSDSLSEELNMARRTLLQSEWFRQTFPGKVQFSPDQNRREQYKNLAGGQSIATSTEGTLTGKGADYLLVDDILSPQQSYSDLERVNANRFFDSTLRSRLNEPERGVIIVICQRLHEADLAGHLLENEPGVWTRVNLPMEAEQDEEIVFPISGRVMHRKAGDLLHPVRWPKSWCEKHKRTVGPFIWSSQFQQRPAPAGGAIFRREWFQTYRKAPEKGSTIIALDTAYSVKKTADYSAASVWTAFEGRYYLRFVWRERVAYPDLKRAVEELADVWAPDAVLVEEKASGQSLVQSLKEETSLPVVGIPVDSDKVTRAHSVTALFSAGRVNFPEDAPWLPAYLHELELFPSAAHDDQVDTTTIALRYLRAQHSGGRLTWLDTVKAHAADWARGIFGSRKKTADKPAAVVETPAGCVTVNNFDNSKQPRPCPACQSICTIALGGPMNWHCNQCRCDFLLDGTIVNKPKSDDEPGHVHRWRNIPGGRKCDDCEVQEMEWTPVGAGWGDLPGGGGRRRR